MGQIWPTLLNQFLISYSLFRGVLWLRVRTLEKSGHSNCGRGRKPWDPSLTAAGNVNWYIHFGEQFGNSLLSRRRAHPITHQIHSCVHVFWRNSCPDAQDTHRRPLFQLLLLSNIRSELSGINHTHFVMLMGLERAPWRRLLWTFAAET